MKRVILSYPADFANLEKEACMISARGLFISPSFSEKKLTISTLFNSGEIEKVFTEDAIATYKKCGIDVEVVE